MSILKRAFGYVLALAILAVPLVAYANRQALMDWWLLHDYTPPAAVVSLAGQDNMTAQARHIFYVNHPELIDQAATFRQDCTVTEQTIVLGCYHGNQDGIFIYNVQDSQLNGVQQVTAAHEMLHAAYDRLNAKDREYINGLLNDYYANSVRDQRLIDTINAYKKTEPKDVVNEMHSIFGTEIANLPAPLENYYKRYFSNRAAITTFAANYQSEFTRRISEIASDDTQLAAMKQNITAEEKSLSQQLAQLEADRNHLDNLRNSGQIAAYNAAVPGFNAEVDAYNQSIHQLQIDIAAYNKLVNERNAIASELRALENALDTRLSTQPAQ